MRPCGSWALCRGSCQDLCLVENYKKIVNIKKLESVTFGFTKVEDQATVKNGFT